MGAIYSLFALLAGMGLPLQIGLNHMVAKASTALWSSAISFVVGILGGFSCESHFHDALLSQNSHHHWNAIISPARAARSQRTCG